MHKQRPLFSDLTALKDIEWIVPDKSMSAFAPVQVEAEDRTIVINGQIGDYPDDENCLNSESFRRKLKALGEGDVTVALNSPGGSYFEGVAIYNMLVNHKGQVAINIIGEASSAASIVAMAGDSITMGQGCIMMIHNASGIVYGNANKMRSVAEIFSKLDEAMANVYAARTGIDKAEIRQMMDNESYMTAEEACERGFVDTVIENKCKKEDDRALSAKDRLDKVLAKSGIPRSERRAMYQEIRGTHNAAENGTQDAAAKAGLEALLQTIKQAAVV